MGPFKPILQSVPGPHFLPVKAAGEAIWQLTFNECEVKETWIYTSTPPYNFKA
jgi:hypothetical protein